MTQRANPSVNRPVEAFKSAGAIALAGGTENGWISPSDNPSDISVQDRAILDEDLNAFNENSQSDSLDVTIDAGEAFVFGSWIVKDNKTVISLAPNTNNQTVYVGWNNNEANDIIIGKNQAFNNGPNDTDQRIPLYEYDTDSTGVTLVTDKRQLGKVIETSKVEILEELGLPSYSNSANAPQEVGRVIYVDGSESELKGIYVYRDGSYNRVRDTQDEIEDYVDNLLTSSGGITLSYDDNAGNLNIDGASQYTDSDSRDAVLPNILAGNAITTTVDTNADPDNITITVGSDEIQLNEIDQSISPTWTGTHTFSNSIIQNSSPKSDSDVATKQYVDSTDQGLDIKDSCVAATETNIDLTSSADPNPIDDVTLSNGDRVLLKEQTDSTENGIYVASTATDPTTWSRSSDADQDSEVTNGFFTFIEQGLQNSSIGFVLTTNSPTLGTDNLNFSPFSDAGQTSAGDALTKTGDTISHIDTSSQSNVSANSGAAITDLNFDEQGHTTSASTTDFDSRYVQTDGDTISGELTVTGSIDASNAKEIISAKYNSLTDAQNASVSEGSIVYIEDEESLYVKKSSSLNQVPTFDIIKTWVNNNSDVPKADVARGFENRTDYPNNPDSGRVVFRTDKT
jgi:hypothetical protein